MSYIIAQTLTANTEDSTSSTAYVDANVAPATDTITINAHGYSTGLLGRLTTTGTLPAGLALSTDYFVIVVDGNSIKLATTYANAVAGTAVDITAAAGTGTHTFTPVALAASIKLQSSVDGVDWFDIAGKTASITTTGSTLFTLVDFAEPMFRTYVTQTSGQGVMNLKTTAYIKK